VETEAELSVVKSLGCDKIQGFFFGRPMSAHDAGALFGPGEGHMAGGRAA
jgi:EAL domain-containing protein (putative c-di-GMP-specific phosphodiesterase class I)